MELLGAGTAAQVSSPGTLGVLSLLRGLGWWLLCTHKARIVPRGPQGLSFGEAEQLKTRAGPEENEV